MERSLHQGFKFDNIAANFIKLFKHNLHFNTQNVLMCYRKCRHKEPWAQCCKTVYVRYFIICVIGKNTCTWMPFQPSLMFEGKARSPPSSKIRQVWLQKYQLYSMNFHNWSWHYRILTRLKIYSEHRSLEQAYFA